MPLIYTKNLMNRLDWFLSLGMDIERLERMAELNSYPMRGSACLHYNRPCKYFNTCSLHSLDFPKELEEDENEYDFHFDLQGLIDSHIGRIGKVNVI
jgi:hypothetical protein